METELATEFLKTIIRQAEKYKELGDKTIARLNEADLHYRPNAESNNVVVLIKHICGNMISRSTDFLTTNGEKPDRNRDGEFEDYKETKEELLEKWKRGWEIFFNTLRSLKPEDLLKTVEVGERKFSVLKAIVVQLNHYTHHIGQIIYIAKILKGPEWETLSIPKKKAQKQAL